MCLERLSSILVSLVLTGFFGYFVFFPEQQVSTGAQIGRVAGVLYGIGVCVSSWLVDRQAKRQPQPADEIGCGAGIVLMTGVALQALSWLVFDEASLQTLTQFFMMIGFVVFCFVTLMFFVK